MSARDAILRSGFDIFESQGFEAATVASICRAAGVSNGSFFHAFASKERLAAELFLGALTAYHDAMLAALADGPGASEGVAGLVGAHLDWVVASRREARFIFEQSRSEWMVHVRDAQREENARFGQAISAWRAPLASSGALRDLPASMFVAQLIGPAQIFCRAWLSGRSSDDPRAHASELIDCARRALVA